jgi:hypothetical protein
VRAVPHLCEFYPGISLTTEEKARENLSQGKKILIQGRINLIQGRKNLIKGKKNLSRGKKNLSQGKKYLSQCTVDILPNVYIVQLVRKI